MPRRPTAHSNASDSSQRPGRGLHGSMDEPSASVASGTEFLVGGWVVHERLRVDRVLVTVDGEIVAHTRVDEDRPDVFARWPQAPGAATRGWSVAVPPLEGPRRSQPTDEVVIRAFAHVEDDDDPTRLGPWVMFAELARRVAPSGHSFGRIDVFSRTAPGLLRVTGTAWAPSGLAGVELTTSADDADWQRARHSLPTPPSPWDHDAEARLAGFSGYVRIPDAEEATVRAVAVSVDGRRYELEPVTATVLSPEDDGVVAGRQAALLARFDQRLRHLARPDGATPRIMVASHALDLGGAQGYLGLLTDRLRERGIGLCVATRSAGPLQAELEEAGLPVLVYGRVPSDIEVLEGQVLQVAEFAAEHGVVGCLANSLPAFPAVIAAQRLGLPTMWAIHESFDLDVFWAEAYGGVPDDVAAAAVRALAACDEVVFEAEATRALYADVVPEPQRSLIPYGVETAAIDELRDTVSQERARADLDLDAGAVVLLCVGTVEPRKAQTALVRAFARIPAHRRRGAQLVVVGLSSTPYSEALRRFVVDAGLADDVRLVDATPDILRFYLAADVLVSASDIESVPRTMLEAMTMGRPVAATAAFGVSELVVDSVTGFLCKTLDLGSLQGMLERVVGSSRGELDSMGRAAREHVLEAHDPSGYVDHFGDRMSDWVRPQGG